MLLKNWTDFFVKKELSDVQTLFSVGRFSNSSILMDAIKDTLGPEIDVIIPRDPGLAVLKGAVICGFEPEIMTTRFSLQTYGEAMQRNLIL